MLFTGFIPTPHMIAKTANMPPSKSSSSSVVMLEQSGMGGGVASSGASSTTSSSSSSGQTLKPGNVLRLFPTPKPGLAAGEYSMYQATGGSGGVAGALVGGSHSRASSIDLQSMHLQQQQQLPSSASHQQRLISHSRKSSNEYVAVAAASAAAASASASGSVKCHSRNQSLELKQIKTDLGILLTDFSSHAAVAAASAASSASTTGAHHRVDLSSSSVNSSSNGTNNTLINGHLQVNLIVGHHNWIAVAFAHYVCCYKLKEGMGWQLVSLL